ncbi:ABC transporter permease [Aurantibacter sp.]|uniref:ABC transporter permease n=1 Tax=Aurantibacter sp. TaxID=2807103 RepID=UPI003266363C
MRIKSFFSVVLVKAFLNLKSETSNNKFSYMWWILEPLLHMSAYYFVFSFLLDRGGPGYGSFLLMGLVPWLWFSKTVNKASFSLIQGRSLMNKMYILKIFFPITIVLQSLIKQVFVFAVLFFLIWGLGVEFSKESLWVILIIIVELLLILSVSLFFAVVVPFFRDFSIVVPIAMQFMMFCSGIFFSYKEVPERLHAWFFLNPMAVVLKGFRDVLIDKTIPSFDELTYVVVFSIVLVLFSFCLYKKLDYKIAKAVLE